MNSYLSGLLGLLFIVITFCFYYLTLWILKKRQILYTEEKVEKTFSTPEKKYILRHPSGKVVTEIPIIPTEEGIYFAAGVAKKMLDSHPFYHIAIVPYTCHDYKGIGWYKWDTLCNSSEELIIEKDDKN
jgi:hypothetical protein